MDQSFDADDEWSNMQSLRSPRSKAGITVCADRIYLFGGHPEGLSNVEIYNITSNKWFDGSPMNSWRFNVGIAELNKYIYAVGGFYGSENIDIVERYDPLKDSWTTVSLPYPHNGCLITAINSIYFAFLDVVFSGQCLFTFAYIEWGSLCTGTSQSQPKSTNS